MLDPEDTNDQTTSAEGGPPSGSSPESSDTPPAPVKKTAAKRTAKAPAKKAAAKRTTKKVAKSAEAPLEEAAPAPVAPEAGADAEPDPTSVTTVKKAAPRKRATRKAAPPAPAPVAEQGETGATEAGTLDVPVPVAETAPETGAETASEATTSTAPAVLFQAPVKKAAPRKRATRKAAPPAPSGSADDSPAGGQPVADDTLPTPETGGAADTVASDDVAKPRTARKSSGGNRKRGGKAKKDQSAEDTSGEDTSAPVVPATGEEPTDDELAAAAQAQGETPSDAPGDAEQDESPGSEDDDASDDDSSDDDSDDDSGEGDGGPRRRRRRGGRRRRKPSDGNTGGNGSDGSNGPDGADDSEGDGSSDNDDSSRAGDGDGQDDSEGESTGSRRRRRRRRSSDDGDGGSEDPENTVTRVRKPRNPEDEITSIGGSTRLEAKKQRRREGREAGRRRAPIVSEAEFLTRRESVDRVMVIRQQDDLTQIGVLEDKVLVEHYVARESQISLIGNVYLGRVQNVLPSMEAAFIDIGKGRNAVLYAGEVNWQALGHREGQPRKIESVLSSGQTILVQVTKDPIGHKGARLTGQVSLPGRFLVYVPEGNTSGISRKLPDTERNRLKSLLKEIVPDTAGVIVRTAAEGASEEELTQDVERLTARWSDIEDKVKSGKGPQLLYGEPDLTLKVVRDLFTEDFARLVVQGDDAWDLVDGYVSHVAPDLRDRLERFEPADGPEARQDLFATYRVDEQIAKGLDRKVWLPSGGSLIIDRTEAMTVVDVNTGKFTGSGGNLEETVTKNNLEAAEEIVRQLRLRDIGGIIVVDFIDMVLESNRDLVLRRLVECLGRDRTRHQVAEVTSLGLVQMTRKRIGTGLLESFSHDCEACKGRGVVVSDQPVDPASRPDDDDGRGRGGRSRGGRARGGRGDDANGNSGGDGNSGGNGNGGNRGGGAAPAAPSGPPSPKVLAHSRPPEKTDEAQEQQPVAPIASAEQFEDRSAEQNVIGRPTAQTPEPQDVPSETGGDATPAEPGTQAPDQTAGQATARTADQAPAATDAEPAADRGSEEPVKGDPGTPAAAAPTTPEPPRLVTSTRRRTARRAAGPPTAVQPGVEEHIASAPETASGDEPWPDDAELSGEGAELDEDGGPNITHVPVKRKRSRKR